VLARSKAIANRVIERGPTAVRTESAASVAADPQGIERLSPAVREALGELAGAPREG
jgi:hypothetical protein